MTGPARRGWRAIPAVSGASSDSGHFPELREDLLGLLRRAAAEGDGGSIRLAAGSLPFIVLNDPAAIETMLADPAGAFTKPKLELWRELTGSSVLTSNGARWRRARQRIAPMMGARYLRRHARIAAEAAVDRMRTWTPGEAVAVLGEMRMITLPAMLRSFCGGDEDVDVGAFTAELDTVMEYVQARESGRPDAANAPTEPTYRAAVSALRESARQLVLAHGSGDDDLVGLLVANHGPGGRSTVEEVCDEVLGQLIAGYESTATALAWTLLAVAVRPDVAARLRAEIERTTGGRTPGVAEMDEMAYLRAVFSESLRLHPPSWGILRAAECPVEVDGVRLPAGACLLASQYTMHRGSRWYDRPEEFLPERWLEGAPLPPRFAYFPFGGGRRVCPGQRLAQVTACAVVAQVLPRFELRLVDDEVRPAVHVTLHPDQRTLLRVLPVGRAS
jgi:cytochrome P450